MRKGTSGSASTIVQAPPEQVYDTVSDVTRVPEWSPECVGGRWLGGATGPEVGARFEGRNRRGPVRWRTRPKVVAADRPREFAFVMGLPGYGALTKWSFEVEPGEQEGTSRLTESYEILRDLPKPIVFFEKRMLRVPDRERDLQHNLEVSVERVREVIEADQPRVG